MSRGLRRRSAEVCTAPCLRDAESVVFPVVPAVARTAHRASLLATALSGPSFGASPLNLRHAVPPMRFFQWRIRL
jgi:hypothetical protein